ncbi:transmembrane protein, putative [Medicago truncatula]|uniref:Transmembrane protein, putative n=1 Tax=Medicago truncatula TaxID=3880 RepID=G7J2F6_MEDTR|nr:transmembrane protein, putative [Medicago truncatula]
MCFKTCFFLFDFGIWIRNSVVPMSMSPRQPHNGEILFDYVFALVFILVTPVFCLLLFISLAPFFLFLIVNSICSLFKVERLKTKEKNSVERLS